MTNTLKAFEELLHYRLTNDRELSTEKLRELLETWYQMRREAERETPPVKKTAEIPKPAAPKEAKTAKAPP